jgi:hypothetical protein
MLKLIKSFLSKAKQPQEEVQAPSLPKVESVTSDLKVETTTSPQQPKVLESTVQNKAKVNPPQPKPKSPSTKSVPNKKKPVRNNKKV